MKKEQNYLRTEHHLILSINRWDQGVINYGMFGSLDFIFIVVSLDVIVLYTFL